MSGIDKFLDGIVRTALAELRAASIPLFTFALYHDHESAAISVCVDTKESSLASVAQSNQWSMRHFARHIQDGCWQDACLFQANTGRSLSLGDFARVNVARAELPSGIEPDEAFYLAMARVVIANQKEILSLAPEPEAVVFCCSSADSEVGLVWSTLERTE